MLDRVRHWIFTAVVVSLLTIASSANAAFPGNNGKIVFAQSGANKGLYTVNPDGSGLTLIRPITPPDWVYPSYADGYGPPRWSPDGQKIAFVALEIANHPYEIHFINPDGSGEVDTNVRGTHPAWSPDGTQLVFIGTANGDVDIFRMDSDGTGIVNLTNSPVTEFDPVWSPDGTKIAFATVDNNSSQPQADIAVMNPDGSGRVNLTQTPNLYERYPDWSPDGEQLAWGGIYRMNADGTDVVFVNAGTAPVWSPDRVRIAYQGPGQMASVGIRSMAYDGSDDRIIANGGVAPDWQRVSGTGANLSILKADAPDPAYVGEVLTYTLTVRNFPGPSTAENVVVTDDLPGSVTFVSADPSLGSCGLSGSTLTCQLGDLPAGAVATIEVEVQPTVTGSVVNSASVASSTSDPDPSNNQFTATTTVAPVAGYPRPKGATPIVASLVPAFAACSTGNRTHGPPLAYPACSPPTQASQWLTVGTPDANGNAANSMGSVRLDVLVGNPGTSEDEADVRIQVGLSDVRRAQGLNDYPGELDVQIPVRITDRLNGNPSGFPATVKDVWTLRATVPCATTASPAIGATCNVTTSVDAITPKAVAETKRSIWALGKVQVFDAGECDRVADQCDSTPFAVQGVFVP